MADGQKYCALKWVNPLAFQMSPENKFNLGRGQTPELF